MLKFRRKQKNQAPPLRLFRVRTRKGFFWYALAINHQHACRLVDDVYVVQRARDRAYLAQIWSEPIVMREM